MDNRGNLCLKPHGRVFGSQTVSRIVVVRAKVVKINLLLLGAIPYKKIDMNWEMRFRKF